MPPLLFDSPNHGKVHRATLCSIPRAIAHSTPPRLDQWVTASSGSEVQKKCVHGRSLRRCFVTSSDELLIDQGEEPCCTTDKSSMREALNPQQTPIDGTCPSPKSSKRKKGESLLLLIMTSPLSRLCIFARVLVNDTEAPEGEGASGDGLLRMPSRLVRPLQSL